MDVKLADFCDGGDETKMNYFRAFYHPQCKITKCKKNDQISTLVHQHQPWAPLTDETPTSSASRSEDVVTNAGSSIETKRKKEREQSIKYAYDHVMSKDNVHGVQSAGRDCSKTSCDGVTQSESQKVTDTRASWKYVRWLRNHVIVTQTALFNLKKWSVLYCDTNCGQKYWL